LRDFVKRCLTHEFTHCGNAVLIGQQISFGVPGIGHGFEFHDLKNTFTFSGAILVEEWLAIIAYGKKNGYDKDQGG
jgi:hypothetical protein